jgi:hypothetical protein
MGEFHKMQIGRLLMCWRWSNGGWSDTIRDVEHIYIVAVQIIKKGEISGLRIALGSLMMWFGVL